MADPNDTPVEPVIPTSAPAEAAPVQAAPEQAAAVVEPAAAAVVAPEVVAPVAEAPAAPEAPAAEPTLLEKFDTDAKAKEAKPAEGDKPKAEPVKSEAEGDKSKTEGVKDAAAEPAKPDPVEYKYTLPETLKMDDALKGSLHEALDGFRANPAEGVQKLVDLHNQQMLAYDQQLRQDQIRVFNETRKDWRTKVMADEEIGGSGYQTAMGAIARMRDLAVPESERSDFESFLRVTGAGDHPAFLKMMHRFAQFFDEPGLPPPNPQPTKNGGAPPNRRATLYDNPRSPRNRQ